VPPFGGPRVLKEGQALFINDLPLIFLCANGVATRQHKRARSRTTVALVGISNSRTGGKQEGCVAPDGASKAAKSSQRTACVLFLAAKGLPSFSPANFRFM
jgi:hypothetical protein